MIANPLIPAFRYDPYTKRLTRELYEHEEMRRIRGEAVHQARESLKVTAKTGEHKEMWAVVLGTLGRQGNLRVLRVSERASKRTPLRPLKSLTARVYSPSHDTSHRLTRIRLLPGQSHRTNDCRRLRSFPCSCQNCHRQNWRCSMGYQHSCKRPAPVCRSIGAMRSPNPSSRHMRRVSR